MTLEEYKHLVMERAQIAQKLLPLTQKARALAGRLIPKGSHLISTDLALDHIAATYSIRGEVDTQIIPIERLFEGE